MPQVFKVGTYIVYFWINEGMPLEVCIAMGSVVISMKISFYYVDENYIKYLKEKEISARGFTCVPNVEYHNQRTQN